MLISLNVQYADSFARKLLPDFGIGDLLYFPRRRKHYAVTLIGYRPAQKEALMDMQVLREFVEFSKHLNFSAAARFLHMSQSSLSKHIADLEIPSC